MSATADSSAPPPAPASLAEDFIDIWFAPSAVFARRAQGGVWGPFLLSLVLLCALFYAAMGAMQGIFDVELAKALAEARTANPALTDEQLAQMQGVMEGSMKYGGLVAMPLILLALGAVTWLVAKVLGGTLSFGGGIMVASFAYLPKAVDLLAFLGQSFLLDGAGATARFQYSLGVGRFLDPTMSQGLYNLLGRVDVFTIWVTVLIALGLQYAGKVERPKAIAGAVAVWVIGGLPALLQLLGGK